MKTLIRTLFLFWATTAVANAKVIGETVTYGPPDAPLKGYIAYDDASKAKRPGILVVHEWWGHNEYARKRADMLAELGYTALAVDMYGNGKQAAHPDDAQKFSSELQKNPDLTVQRFQAALELLRKHPLVVSTNIAAMGYCMGGGISLEMARRGADLKGVVSFHGSLAGMSQAAPGAIKSKILVFTGADDPFVPPDQVNGFETEMKKAGADYMLVSMAGAKHSFTNPQADEFGKKFGLPLAYNADADKTSWEQAQKFLEALFAGK